MEHLALPYGASFTESREDLVPYVGNEDYLCVPFLDYPRHAGYDFLVRDSTPYVDIDAVKANPPSEEFVQNWLFFGWLREVLGRFVEDIGESGLYRHDDFVREEDGLLFLTTAKLNERLEKWCQIVIPQISHLQNQYLELWIFTDMIIFLNFLPDLLPVNHKLSLCSTMEAVMSCIYDVFQEQPYARNWKSTLFNLAWREEERIPKMKEGGWCPYDALLMVQKWSTLNVALYLEKLDKKRNPLQSEQHQDCDTSVCRKTLSLPGSHHRHPDCGCSEISIDGQQKEEMFLMLKSDILPLLKLTRSGEAISVSLVRSSPETEYTALSHVWADGLGNNEANALRQCQLSYIHDLIKDIDSQSGDQGQESLVWIDTLCVPRGPGQDGMREKALTLMRNTYQQAEKVVVLDAELEATNHTNLEFFEILTRVFSSSWMRRLWTLQEAALAEDLWVKFRDGAWDLDEMVVENYDSISTLSLKRLELFLKFTCFGIRPPGGVELNEIYPLSRLALTARGRLASKNEDEPICLSTLLNLPLESLLSVPKEDRMQQFWRLLSESPTKIPSCIIFDYDVDETCPRLLREGYRWAPSSVLRSRVLDVVSSIEERGVEIDRKGLLVEFPGIQLSPLVQTGNNVKKLDQYQYIRMSNGEWFQWVFPSRLIGELSVDYSQHAIILSRLPTSSNLSGFAILVRVHETRDNIKFVNRVCSIQVPVLMESATRYHATFWEAAFQHLWRRGVLDLDQSLQSSLSTLSEAQYEVPNQEYVDSILEGCSVARGTSIPETQRWCVD